MYIYISLTLAHVTQAVLNVHNALVHTHCGSLHVRAYMRPLEGTAACSVSSAKRLPNALERIACALIMMCPTHSEINAHSGGIAAGYPLALKHLQHELVYHDSSLGLISPRHTIISRRSATTRRGR